MISFHSVRIVQILSRQKQSCAIDFLFIAVEIGVYSPQRRIDIFLIRFLVLISFNSVGRRVKGSEGLEVNVVALVFGTASLV